MNNMEKKLVKSQYGILITVYEVVYEGRTLWFDENAIEAAAKTYAVRGDMDEDEMAWMFRNGE
ncbi:MAG: hypothetical protein ACXQS5_00095, partial [Candidatus Methanospirareceae archaeon]